MNRQCNSQQQPATASNSQQQPAPSSSYCNQTDVNASLSRVDNMVLLSFIDFKRTNWLYLQNNKRSCANNKQEQTRTNKNEIPQNIKNEQNMFP